MFKNIQIIGLKAPFLVEKLFNTTICQNVALILLDSQFSYFIPIDNASEEFRISFALHLEERPLKNLFQVGETIYYVAASGALYQLLWTPSGGNSSSEGFLSGPSPVAETYSWKQIHNFAPDIICVEGSSENIASIHRESSEYFLNVWEIRGDTKQVFHKYRQKMCTVKDTTDCFFIKRFHSRELIVQFLKFFHQELCILEFDLFFIAKPNGETSLLPVSSNIGLVKPVPVYLEDGKVVLAEVAACGGGLIVVYSSGKVVLTYYCLNSLSMKFCTRYLSTEVTCAILLKQNNTSACMWSNGDAVFATEYFQLNNSNVISQEKVIPIKGIVALSMVRELVVGQDANGAFYKICVNNAPIAPSNACTVLENLNIIGNQVDKLKNEIDLLNYQITALEDEQIDASQIHVKVDGTDLHAQNLGLRTFSKLIWSFMVESKVVGKSYVKAYHFSDDFAPQARMTFPLEYFLDLGCKLISVKLVGNLDRNERRLIVRFNNVFGVSADGSDYVNDRLLASFSKSVDTH